MTRPALTCAVTLVRAWVRLYTWRATAPAADARRAEIDSDLWEFLHDHERSDSRWAAAAILGRLAGGIGDDLRWRAEQCTAHESLLLRRTLTIGCAIVLVLSAWFVPTRLAGGRARVLQCASIAEPASSTAALRLQVVSCAGAFFLPRN